MSGLVSVVSNRTVVREDTAVGSNASLSHCLVGKRCQLHSGVRLGNRGFGFTLDSEGYVDVPQLEISSSDLRERFRDGRPVDYLVPPEVLAVIGERDLYGGAG